MNVQDLSDSELVRRGMADVMARRFYDKEFVVLRHGQGGSTSYVASVDSYDGDTEWTADPRQARIFCGSEWAEFWAKPAHYLIVPAGLPI